MAMKIKYSKQSGFSMIELMVGITIASLLTIAVISVFVNLSGTFSRQTSRNAAAADAWEAYAVVSRLLEHAEISSIQVSYGAGSFNEGMPPAPGTPPIELAGNDEIQITFRTPSGMNVWPNNQGPAFNRNQMTLTWQNHGTDKYEIKLVISDGAVANPEIVLTGGSEEGNSTVINFDIWPLDINGAKRTSANDEADGGYWVVINTRAGMKTAESDPVFSVSGRVVPRN